MKMIAGAACFAWLKRSRTRLAPTPTIASMNSEAEIEKNGTSASPATARASSVFPVPGGPARSTPFGIAPPTRLYLLGLRRKSTTSMSSSSASSIPATSRNVVRWELCSYRRAPDRPNEPSIPPAELRRASATNSPTSSSVGPKPNTIVCHSGVPVSTGLAFTVTFFEIRSLDRPSSPNVGRTVWNFVFGFLPFPGGYSTAVLKVPWISSPFELISETLPFWTWL